MADFKIAYDATFKNEKGYSVNKNDRGNWTGGEVGKGILAGTINGITCWEVEEYYGRPITADDVKNFPKAAQMDIYKKKYWSVMRGDEIKVQDYANSIFDFGVNAGVAANGIGKWQLSIGVPVTKKMDDYTLRKTNEWL